MKYILALSIAWLATVTSAWAAGSAQSSFSVAGTLIPGACRLEFANGGLLVLPDMPIAQVNQRHGMTAEHEVVFHIRCDDKMQSRFTVTDEYRASATVPRNNAYTLVDKDSGAMVGQFELWVKNATADGAAAELYTSVGRQSSPQVLVDTEQFFGSAAANLARGLPETSEAEVLTGTLSVLTRLNPGIKANTKIHYTGTANFILKYD